MHVENLTSCLGLILPATVAHRGPMNICRIKMFLVGDITSCGYKQGAEAKEV